MSSKFVHVLFTTTTTKYFKIFAQFSIKSYYIWDMKYVWAEHAHICDMCTRDWLVQNVLQAAATTGVARKRKHMNVICIVSFSFQISLSPSAIYYYHSVCVYNFDFIKKLECESVCVCVQCNIFYIWLCDVCVRTHTSFLLIFHVTFPYLLFEFRNTFCWYWTHHAGEW